MIALAADFRLGTPAARTAFLFARVGLAGCDMGACTLLPRMIGQGRAAELLYTGRAMTADEGAALGAGEVFGVVRGPLRSILTAERTALNFLGHLSGIATLTRRCVEALSAGGGTTRLLDTRKTTPGWRVLEKAAVRAGGATNHRLSLGDGVLIKDNHVAACGGVGEAVRRARARAGAMLKIEVEVVDLPGLDAAMAAGADIVLLDNMTDEAMAAAVKRAAGRVLLEASGNMTQARLPRVAATGVDFVSMGALTHSARAVDISFELS
jgi:nicotinate-nucleotide pyrophosphorylase (carboxylating)